jgi:hypothetical protein
VAGEPPGRQPHLGGSLVRSPRTCSCAGAAPVRGRYDQQDPDDDGGEREATASESTLTGCLDRQAHQHCVILLQRSPLSDSNRGSSLAAESIPPLWGAKRVAEPGTQPRLGFVGGGEPPCPLRVGMFAGEIGCRDGSGRSARGRLTGSLGTRGTTYGRSGHRPGGGQPFQLVSSSGT